MFIARVPNRSSPPAILLRESYRENGKVKTRTLANLSKLPASAIETLKRSLKGEQLVPLEETLEIIASPHHGHVDAVLKALRQLGLARLIDSRPSRERDLVVAMIAARILAPSSKLATARWWHNTTLPVELGVADAEEADLYAALDWLLERQGRIEKKLAARHLEESGLALYDLSSSYFEGSHCPLAAWRELLFVDEDQAAKKSRDPVAPAKRSESALRKAKTRTLDDGSTVHSFQALLSHLGTIVRNQCRFPGADASAPPMAITTTPNAKQKHAYELLDTIVV